jgi:hypothetical protein
MAERVRVVGSECEISADLDTGQQIRTKEGSASPVFLGHAIRNTSSAIIPSVIREIEIWRVAVMMVNRYADEAKANSFQRAAELAAEGDHAGAAIWRRVTVAIEQLTDTTDHRTDNGSI